MTAEAIAGELGKALRVVRLDSVVSKYVGETGKNIAGLFRSARGSDTVLFIDEADALFSSRLVSGGHHARYINQEVNVLLAEIETFDGTLILATNRPEDIDPAFERRIPFHVRFPHPDSKARAAIWRATTPAEAPLAEDVDVDALAEMFDCTGGMIRNIALRAAFAAAGNGGVITQGILLEAGKSQIPLTGEREIGFQIAG